ncbi:MAG: hypothetical protein L0229_08015 [Blastocatellia bacterium]|nr:hypothetical protein [Blastocatellia bacterium]
MTKKRAALIYNPMSGRAGRRAEEARLMVELLGKRGIDATSHATREPNDATRLARESVEAGADIIIGYGGDGTLNEVLQGIVGSRAALAVWAGGTSNVVARDLGLMVDIERLADIIAAGKTKRIALGVARRKDAGEQRSRGAEEQKNEEVEEMQDKGAEERKSPPAPLPPCPLAQKAPLHPYTPAQKERYFLMFAGIGLDASITRNVNPKLKRKTGEFAFWVSGIKHLATWEAEPFTVEVDGEKYESVFAVIGNGKGYGGGISITPHANLEDPWFEVSIFPRRANNLAYLSDLARCVYGSPEKTNATMVRGRHVVANSSDAPWVEVDGEVIGPLPMEFYILPDALPVIIP